MGLNNAFGDMILNFVMAMMFLGLPGFWVTALRACSRITESTRHPRFRGDDEKGAVIYQQALTWADTRVGGVAQSLVNGTKDAQTAGGKGGDMLMKAATRT